MRPYGGLTSGNPCGPRPHGPRLAPGPSGATAPRPNCGVGLKVAGPAGAPPPRRHRRRRPPPPPPRRRCAPAAPHSADRQDLRGLRSSRPPAERDRPRGRQPAPLHRDRPRGRLAPLLHRRPRRRCRSCPSACRQAAAPAPSCSTPTARTACSFQDPTPRPATAPIPDCLEAAACREPCRCRTLGGVNSGPFRYCLKISRACAFSSGVKSIRSFSCTPW